MKAVLRKRAKTIIRVFFMLLILMIFAFLWIILVIPSFHLPHILNTFEHKSVVAQVVTADVNNRTPDGWVPSRVEVEIVYEYSPTCFVTLITLHIPIYKSGGPRMVMLFEHNQSGNWQRVEGNDITFESENGILPQRPSHMHCPRT